MSDSDIQQASELVDTACPSGFSEEVAHNEDSNRICKGGGDAPEILEPDHPLMKRFQDALKTHLERQLQRLDSEVFDLGMQLRKKEAEHEEIGVNVYDAQQEAEKLQKLIDNFHENLMSIMNMREEMQKEVEEIRKQHKEETEKLNKAKKKEAELHAELKSLMMLEQQFIKWEKEMESELVVSQRISEKAKQAKRDLIEEKKKQDLLILRLMTEVANLEAQLNLLDAQFEVKDAERQRLGQIVADSNADLEGLQREHHKLMQAWNSLVISMQLGDKTHSKVVADYNQLKEHLNTLLNEIESIKKSTNKEMVKNEQLTIFLQRIQYDMANTERLIGHEEDKKGALEVQMCSVNGMIEQTEKDMQQALSVFHQVSQEENVLRKEVEKLSNEKRSMEDTILKILEEQITNDKAVKYLNKVLRKHRNTSRNQELTLVSVENEVSKTMLEIEQQKALNQHSQLLLDELEKEVAAQEKELNDLESELNDTNATLNRKQNFIDALNKKLECEIHKTGDQSKSPQEIKIIALEKHIADTVEKCEKIQQQWLRKQSIMVQMYDQRKTQLQDINFLRKQLLIMEQKNLKIGYEIECLQKQEQQMNRSISAMNNKLVSLNLQLSRRREYKDSLDKDNVFIQSQYLDVLKEAEMESIQLQAYIQSLEEEKIQLAETFHQAQRDQLAWEKKVQLAVETKQQAHQDKSAEGEIGAMKSEIQRMKVRFSQLSKVQDKLLGDLENCISRRETFMDLAEAREQKSMKGATNTRRNFQKKLEDQRNRIKKLKSELKSTDQEITDTENRQEALGNQIKEKESQLLQLESTISEMEAQLQEGKLQKQKNLELLVKRQRKMKILGDIKKMRHRLLHRSEHAMEVELQRQKTTNADLISVLESLILDFPVHKFQLTRALNTLHLPS